MTVRAVIRAVPPVVTLAGLIVALPPCETCTVWPGWKSCPNHPKPPDVFALAVPCLRCRRGGEVYIFATDRFVPCPECDGGWVHHGDYRVLEVLPIVDNGHDLVTHQHSGCILVANHRETGERLVLYVKVSVGVQPLVLQCAVPGGVALIVERVDG